MAMVCAGGGESRKPLQVIRGRGRCRICCPVGNRIAPSCRDAVPPARASPPEGVITTRPGEAEEGHLGGADPQAAFLVCRLFQPEHDARRAEDGVGRRAHALPTLRGRCGEVV